MSSVSAGRMFGASDAMGGPVINVGMNGMASAFPPFWLTSNARRSNESPSNESANATPSGHFVSPVSKSTEPSTERALDTGSGPVGSSLASPGVAVGFTTCSVKVKLSVDSSSVSFSSVLFAPAWACCANFSFSIRSCSTCFRDSSSSLSITFVSI